jgi:transposase
MDRYIGLDVHAQSCTLAVLSATGKKVRCEVIATKAPVLIEALKRIEGHRHLCIEEGTQSAWLNEVLGPHVAELVVAVPEAKTGHKSDEADAWARAEELRVGRIKTKVFKAPIAFSGLRDAARAHVVLTQDLARMKNRLKAIYRSRGLVGMGDEIYKSEERVAWLERLPESKRRRAELFGDAIDALDPLQRQSERWLRAEAKPHSAAKTLESIPGIGAIRAAQIVATVVTPERFRTRRQFWSYCGLAIVTRSSADWVQARAGGGWVRSTRQATRGLNLNRQPLLKSVFKGAATTVIAQAGHPLQLRYTKQLSNGTKPPLAKLTLARTIAALALALWKKREDYDPNKHALTP